ncbi:MAG: 4-amino-4-deoxy-L-arabinose transferase-like glycosyltransferase [Urechidicola sp.]|jgi:4-amino-4-deoxy-L-arabinose transferase-like glycosyltransferase
MTQPKLSFYYYLIVIFLFIGITSMSLFSEGMFMDGLLYSAISNNMANGLGSFWQPYLSNSIFPEFYEHPPLAIGLQSLWFSLFGDSVLVERFYSLFTYLLTGIGLVSVWVQLGKSIKTGWIPLFFWLMVSNVIWAVSNNMLENTMAVFVIFSAWSYLKGIQKQNFLFIILAGFLLSLGFLTKGFVCLYIWAFPLGMYIFIKKITITKAIYHTLILVTSTLLPFLFLYLFSEAANHNLTSYFNKQVMGSIKNVSNVDTRFSIIMEFFQHIILPLSIAILVLIIAKVKKQNLNGIKENKKTIYLLTFILMCGILPIMVSMKQRGFYILTVYPFFGLILGLITLPIAEKILVKWGSKYLVRAIIKGFTVLFIITSVTLSVFQIGTTKRDILEVKDSKLVVEFIGPNQSIDICHSQYGNWSKHGYYARYGNITLERKDEKNQEWFLVNEGECSPDLNLYEESPLKLFMHKLYHKK